MGVALKAASLPELFERAMLLAPAEWPAFLDQHCHDPTQRERLRRLLKAEAGTRHWADDAIGVAGAQQRARERAPVEQLGPWQLGALLGAGGMGRVFTAQRNDGRFEQRVAIKFLHAHRQDPTALRRFNQERRLLARLNDPRVVRLLDAGELDDGTPYVVMEQVDGLPLDAWLGKHPVSLRERVVLLAEIARGVGAAHAAGIVHRDLKPGNVLIAADGSVHLLDFGIARALDDSTAATATVDRAFSLAYAAPEQLAGGSTNAATDVYALGVLLYELVAGRRPLSFDGLNPADAARVLATAVASPPSSWLEPGQKVDLPAPALADLDRICSQALRKSAHERYPDARALVADLERWLVGTPVAAAAPPAWYGLRLWLGLRRWRVAASCGALTALFAAGWGWWHSYESSEQAQRQAQVAADLTAEQRDRAHRLAQLTLDLIASADPRQAPADQRPGSSWLQQVSAQMRENLAQDPQLAGELAAAVAKVWLSLGMPRRALDNVLEAQAALPADPALAAQRRDLQVLQLQALVLLSQPAAARELLARLAPGQGHNPAQDAQIALDAAQIELIEGHAAIAEQALTPLAKRLELEFGALHPLVLRAALLRVDSLVSGGRLAEAQAANELLLARQRRALGADHVDTARSLWRATDLAWRLGQHARARALATETVATFRRRYGEEGRPVFSALVLEGNVLRSAGEGALAEQRYRQAREVGVAALGADHPHLAQLDFNLAQLLEEDRFQLPQALALYRQALSAHEQRLGPTHPTTGLIAWRLGALALRESGAAAALPPLEQAARALADDPARSAQIAVERCTALLAVNRPAEAARALAPAAVFFKPTTAVQLDDQGRKARAAQLAASLRALGEVLSDFPDAAALAGANLPGA